MQHLNLISYKIVEQRKNIGEKRYSVQVIGLKDRLDTLQTIHAGLPYTIHKLQGTEESLKYIIQNSAWRI